MLKIDEKLDSASLAQDNMQKSIKIDVAEPMDNLTIDEKLDSASLAQDNMQKSIKIDVAELSKAKSNESVIEKPIANQSMNKPLLSNENEKTSTNNSYSPKKKKSNKKEPTNFIPISLMSQNKKAHLKIIDSPKKQQITQKLKTLTQQQRAKVINTIKNNKKQAKSTKEQKYFEKMLEIIYKIK